MQGGPWRNTQVREQGCRAEPKLNPKYNSKLEACFTEWQSSTTGLSSHGCFIHSYIHLMSLSLPCRTPCQRPSVTELLHEQPLPKHGWTRFGKRWDSLMTEECPQCVVLPGLSPPSPRYPHPVSFSSFCPEDNPDRDLVLVVLGTEPGMPGQMPLLVWARNVGWGLNSEAFLPVFYRDFFFVVTTDSSVYELTKSIFPHERSLL